MARKLSTVIALGIVLALGGCASKFRTYDGPEVTRIVVFKDQRRMHLLHEDQLLVSYDFELGFEPVGAKQVEGDGKTPEGRYFIDRKNPNSDYHLSVGISYPNAADVAEAARLGKPPGGDIFIHGTPNPFRGQNDWTWGCLSVTNREIEDIYAMVNTGTIIDIFP